MENTKIIINIGRQFGSGGKKVAEAISRKLGIPVYDNELITKAAEESGFSASIFQKNDEKKRVLHLGGLLSSNRYGNYNGNVLSEDRIFKIQSEVIRKIAESGSAIFVGRASDYILRDMDCLDIFISAPMAQRKKSVAERMGISEEEAVSVIEHRDKVRENFYNFFTFSHWGVASNYDLCIDSSILGFDGTADFIIDFGRKRGYIK